MEAKLAGNPKARRAVIGQNIDYAAHFLVNWNADTVRQRAYAYWRAQGQDADEVLRARFGEAYDDPIPTGHRCKRKLTNAESA